MSIWFYLFLIALCISVFLVIKIWIMNREIKNIGESLSNIINTDTNNLITISTNDKNLKKLASSLNDSLKELRKLELEYKNGNRELKSSITNISHDLRTPLTAIRGYLDLIDKDNFNDKQIKYLKIIDKKVQDLIFLTEQLFDFSKTLDIQSEMKKENICINDVLEETIASFYGLFKERNIEPQIQIYNQKIIRYCNENVVKRVLENIISNAIKYSKDSIKIKMDKNGIIEISNNTDLLDSVSVEKIFNRYFTVRNIKKSHGIGLSIAKQLVELMNGTIEAKYQNNNLIIQIKF